MHLIKTVVELLGEDIVIDHIIDGDLSSKVKLAMIASRTGDGVLTEEDLEAIASQLN